MKKKTSYAPPQGGGGHDHSTHDVVETAKTQALKADTVVPLAAMTSNQGLKISDDQNSEKAGVRGGSLLEDFLLREKITAFDHERIPERVVHARGAAAHGEFVSYEDLSGLTMASPFAAAGKKTPCLRPVLDRCRLARIGRYAARRAWFRGEVLHRHGNLGPRRQQHAGVLHQRRDQVPRLDPCREARAPCRDPAGGFRP